MTTTKKSKLPYILIFILILVLAGVASLVYFAGKKEWRITPAGEVEAIGDSGVYVNKKHGFGIMFPSYWKGAVAQDNNGGTEFSLRNKDGRYIPIFRIQPYSDEEYRKLVVQSDNSKAPYFIAYKDGKNYTYMMLIGDNQRSQFSEPFSSGNYKGFGYDMESNISPTFKFIDKNNPNDKFQKSNEFRLMDVKPGDKVGGMKVESIEPFDKNDSATASSLRVSNISIKFSGETTLTGTYENYQINPAVNSAGLVCFRDLDKDSQNKIPSLLWSDSPGRFCFSNQDFAKENFQPVGSTGTATVVIDDYTVNKVPANVTDVARLVKVVEKK